MTYGSTFVFPEALTVQQARDARTGIMDRAVETSLRENVARTRSHILPRRNIELSLYNSHREVRKYFRKYSCKFFERVHAPSPRRSI